MTQIWIQKTFEPIRTCLPSWISDPIRSLGTAFLTPILFSLRTGHFRSSFKKAAVSRTGAALPWYTYPSIDFLRHRSYEGRTVLEFGAGQSTLWWAQRAARVVALEGDKAWFESLRPRLPSNVELIPVPIDTPDACVEAVNGALDARPDNRFDVVVIDGLWREQMIEIAARAVKDTGIIVCDNAEYYGIFEGFRDRGFLRVDFFGNAPGVVLQHCTSVYFRSESFAFEPSHPIPVVAREK
jgi:hypothetical protein